MAGKFLYKVLLVIVAFTVSAAVVINQHKYINQHKDQNQHKDKPETGLSLHPGHTQIMRPRILEEITGFVLQLIAKEIIGHAITELIKYLLGTGGPSLPDLEKTLKGIEKKVDEVQRTLEDLAEELHRARVDDQLGPVIINIEVHFNKLAENIELLTKENITCVESQRKDQIVKSFLHVSTGVESGLDHLRLIIIGKHKFNGVSILADYWNSMVRGQDMLNFTPDEKLRERMSPFLNYLLHLQDMGFSVWYMAVTAKYPESSEEQEYHQKVVNATRWRYAEEEMLVLSHLVGPCDDHTLKGTPAYPISLRCTNGTDRSYGAICYQKYRGQVNDREIPRQCLLTGQWSFSNQGEKLSNAVLTAPFSVLVVLIIWAINDY